MVTVYELVTEDRRTLTTCKRKEAIALMRSTRKRGYLVVVYIRMQINRSAASARLLSYC